MTDELKPYTLDDLLSDIAETQTVEGRVMAEIGRLQPLDGFSKESLDWEVYRLVKVFVSHLCGWDAPKEQQDQGLYDRAMADAIRRLGL